MQAAFSPAVDRAGRLGTRSAGTQLYHGTWWDLHTPDELMAGRFTRLIREGAEFDRGDLRLLARKMTSPQEPAPTPEGQRDPEEDPEITAAYTYLGQFVDHDLSFDPTSRLREVLTGQELEDLEDFRTPRFDLDNLYGRGPDDQPFLYGADGIRMLLGEPMSGNPYDPGARQVPRGPNGRALIGDPRNDENRIVAQLHAIFLRFHNQVADYLAKPGHLGSSVSFDAVRQQVRWHYQWMLVTDFLPAVVNSQTYLSVFADRHDPTPRLPGLPGGRLRRMPVEFSVAAYRFGHSMIRPQYRLNTTIERRPIFVPGGDGTRADDAADLGGFRPIPGDWAIDWQFFIDLGPGARTAATSPLYDPVDRRPQKAYKIDTSLVSPLRDLPPRIASDPSMLALRNLERGNIFRLPSGQAVAQALGEEVISDKDLVIGKATTDARPAHLTEIARSFAGRAPLWAYILSEAQVTSWRNARRGVRRNDIPVKLGPVGGRIVAGVFAALLRGDPTSYLNEGAQFRPIADFASGATFGLAELINVALRPAKKDP
jgi:Animal haem peroxidase